MTEVFCHFFFTTRKILDNCFLFFLTRFCEKQNCWQQKLLGQIYVTTKTFGANLCDNKKFNDKKQKLILWLFLVRKEEEEKNETNLCDKKYVVTKNQQIFTAKTQDPDIQSLFNWKLFELIFSFCLHFCLLKLNINIFYLGGSTTVFIFFMTFLLSSTIWTKFQIELHLWYFGSYRHRLS